MKKKSILYLYSFFFTSHCTFKKMVLIQRHATTPLKSYGRIIVLIFFPIIEQTK